MQRNRLTSRHVDAVIFDMDGLMLDTERLGREHFRRAAADFGDLEIEAVYLQTVGRNGPDTRKSFQEAHIEFFPPLEEAPDLF
jgi:beta-phosphoglucomutase-like phosphatase (HAD superfamily)